ncbi:RHS repeat-associated core domain-containing protein [Hahella sp. HN01]|uniref:RHS repeat-associated core domain-containing protein n=1 Tax=Hahella sp. HN01 TaxID=2847262 RepID=UPI001C1E9A71|nr:RHS repeat-associated core domain-containing protein [Hahella sp. HN01]MBU6951601.1 hypothetical protein [Hahella sp. HN01]
MTQQMTTVISERVPDMTTMGDIQRKRNSVMSSWLYRINLAILALLLSFGTSYAARTTTFYHTDAAGSVVAASDESGNLLWRKSYTPYGVQTGGEEGKAESISYTGKPHDLASGLTYMGARYYDPEIGRFLSTDPVEFTGSNLMSFNRYAYANNNPYKYVDPDGRSAVTAFGGVLYETGQFLTGNGFDAQRVAGALVDGYNGEGSGVGAAIFEDATSFIPAGVVLGTLSKISRLVSISKSAKGLIGVDFEKYLAKTLGGKPGFQVGGRDFDGAIGNRWFEAKSGNYWQAKVQEGTKGFEKFKSDMGARKRIAQENGATYELHSNTPIPSHVTDYLDKKGIPYFEHLD